MTEIRILYKKLTLPSNSPSSNRPLSRARCNLPIAVFGIDAFSTGTIYCGCTPIWRTTLRRISFSSRGTHKTVTAPLNRSAQDCIGCGACVAICPAQCITMQDTEEARTFLPGGAEEVGPARLIHNWNARVSWKKCNRCDTPYPPPSPMEHLQKGQPLPKDFFNICEKCR